MTGTSAAAQPHLNAELAAVIAEAYELFAPYKLGRHLSVCHCNVCLSEANEDAIFATPLRSLSAELLGAYTDAVSAGGPGQLDNGMCHFLPRYLELIALRQPPDPMGLSICLRRLRDFEWRTQWLTAEVAVIERAFDAILADALTDMTLAHWPAGWFAALEFTDYLTMIVTAGGDVDRMLAVWDSAPDPGAAFHMAALRRDLASEPVRLTNAHFAGEFEVAAERIGEFLARPEVDLRLEAAFFAVSDERIQKIISDATWRTW